MTKSIKTIFTSEFKLSHERKMSRKADFLKKNCVRDKQRIIDRRLKALWAEN